VRANTTSTFQQGSSGRGLIAAPSILYIAGDRGETIQVKLKITNDFQTPAKVEIFPSVKNITITTHGTPLFDTTEKSYDNNLSQWVTFDKPNYTIEHREVKEITFSVKVPSSAAGGSHSVFLLLPRSREGEMPRVDGAAAQTIDQLAVPLFLTINSDLELRPVITSMTVSNLQGKKPSLFLWGDAKITTLVENQGNVYFRPYGDIFIHKGDRTKPEKVIPFNQLNNLVPQKSSREFTTIFSTNGLIEEGTDPVYKRIKLSKLFDFKFGRYYATYQPIIKGAQEAKLSDLQSDVEGKTVSFYVLPVQAVIFALLVIVSLLVFLVKRIRQNRKQKVDRAFRMRQ
jgi:hypothetical protein